MRDVGNLFADGYDFRRFDPEVETIAAAWRGMTVDQGREWQPYTPSGSNPMRRRRTLEDCEWVVNNIIDPLGMNNSSFCFVKRKARLAAKEPNVHKLGIEKIVADLAYDLGVPVVPGCLWNPEPENPEKIWFLSLSPFPMDAKNTYTDYVAMNRTQEAFSDLPPKQQPRTVTQEALERRILKEAAAINTALWVFHVWIGDQSEHKNSGNMLISLDEMKENGIRLASIDHAYAKLKFDPSPRFTNMRPTETYPFSGRNAGSRWSAPIDVDAARAMFQRIAEYPRERLEEIVNRLPASLVSEDKKQAWINGLMESKEPTKKVIEKSLTKQVLELPSETGIGSIGKKSASNLML